MSLHIIGLSGKAGSGKDYITDHILSPWGYCKFSFAWHLKVWAVGRGLATYEEVFVTKPPHVRKLLQEEGTERGRMVFGESVWCDTIGVWLRVLHENCGINNWVIPDVRFINEANYIKSLGGKVYRIEAPERVSNNGLSEAARQHISETALDNYSNFDGVIYNNPSMSDTVRSQLLNLKKDI